MTEPELRRMFPKASKAFLSQNAAISAILEKKDAPQSPVARPKATPRKMTNPELEFAFILEAQKRRDEIGDYRYEGVTLRWDGLRYTPDFIVFPPPLAVSGRIKLVEVKGAFIAGNRARAVERFRHAKTYWTQFDFELHQKSKDGWNRLI